MKKNLEKFWIEKLEEFINDITSLVYDDEIWIKQEMWKIAEVTYSYLNTDEKSWEKLVLNWREVNINTTIFISLWELDIDLFLESDDKEKINLIKKASKKLRKKIKNKINEIKTSKDLIEKINIDKLKTKNKNKILILKNSLDEKILLLKYCLNWLVFEEEKAGLDIELKNEEELKINKKQRNIDKELFWWLIKDNPEEVWLCYTKIRTIFEQNKHKINQNEQERFLWYIKKLESFLEIWFQYKESNSNQNKLNELSQYKLSQKDYILWFNLFIEAFKKMNFNVEVNSYAKSISDWPNWFQIPSTESFAFFDFPRFLALNSHENETHNISEHNSQILIWNIRWKWSTQKDEWAAILMENMLKYWEQIFKIDKKTWKYIIDEKKLDFNSNFIKILFWEILTNEELIDFLIISNKLEKDIISVKDRLFRLKRSNKAWVQHKDTTYTRWLFQAAKEINKHIISDGKKWIKFEDLFLWKVWFDEIKLLIEIKNEINSKKILKPMFYSDIVFFAIKQRMQWKELDEMDFIKYISQKYPILDFNEYWINIVSNKTKISIDGIINIWLKNIYTHSTEEERQKVKLEVMDIIWQNISYNEDIIQNALNSMNKLRKKALIKK